ncbi:MAG: methyltransferase domain-containing protein [archaeon]
MIEKMQFKSDANALKWYDKRFTEFGVFNTSKEYNSLMLKYLGINSKSDKMLLDVGCGGGFFLKEAEKFVHCIGTDFSSVALETAKKNTNSGLVLASASRLPFKKESFDFIACLGSLEHFIEIKKALSEMNRVLKKNGKINLYVPNSNFLLFKFNKATQFQPNERLASLDEWKKLIGEFFLIEKVFKHTNNPVGKLLPMNFTNSFSIICKKN